MSAETHDPALAESIARGMFMSASVVGDDRFNDDLWNRTSEMMREYYRRAARFALDAIVATNHAVVELPARPSEYWGPEHQPQWNHYPYTRVDGQDIEIGARSEHVFRVSVAEARIFAADVIAAAAEADR